MERKFRMVVAVVGTVYAWEFRYFDCVAVSWEQAKAKARDHYGFDFRSVCQSLPTDAGERSKQAALQYHADRLTVNPTV